MNQKRHTQNTKQQKRKTAIGNAQGDRGRRRGESLKRGDESSSSKNDRSGKDKTAVIGLH